MCVQWFVLALATVPGLAVAKQLAIIYAPTLAGVYATFALLEGFLGART